MPTPQPLFVLRVNHFDPIWRRCWDRDFDDAGRRFVSYRAIEERWIRDALATCADGVSCFLIEASWVLRHYLERHPEQLERFRQLTREGRFELLGSGENIIDANMVHGETLARNLVLGTLWAEQTLGQRPTTGWHSDGFGSSAQMPQIFRQCGYDWLPAISYNTPDAPYWRGLDGSTIFFSCDMSSAPFGGTQRLAHRSGFAGVSWCKLVPCPACSGNGCPACEQGGFVIGERAELTALPKERLPGVAGVLMLWGEELMPGLHVAADVARLNQERPEFQIRQGTYQDLRPIVADYLARVDNPPADQISSKVENNPSQSGCYVSRIRMKQEHRALEHALLATECWDTLLNAGAERDCLRDVWRQMTLSAFHDAITSSHVDPAYTELQDLHLDLDQKIAQASSAAAGQALKAEPGTVTVFNHHGFDATVPIRVELPGVWAGACVTVLPHSSSGKAPSDRVNAGQQTRSTSPFVVPPSGGGLGEKHGGGMALPVYAVEPAGEGSAVTFLAAAVPALGARTFRLTAAPFVKSAVTERTVACGAFTVDAGEQGITGIAVAGLGAVLDTRQFLFGELVLEHDIGDPWSTRSLDRARERLATCTWLQGIERQGDGVVVTYTGKHSATANPHANSDGCVTYLAWEQRFLLRQGVPWLEVETVVDWYTQSRRLRLAFPSATTLDRGVYEVPYGVLERERYEGTSTDGGSAAGDWPALHWAGVQAPNHTFAVFNQGTPSYRVENGVVLVSVLRSPQIPYCLLEPAFYTAYNYDGMRDHGRHCFRHALYLGPGNWRDNDTGRQAALFNSGLLAVPGALAKPLPGWQVQAEHTNLAAVKTAEDGHGIVLRFAESAGKPETVRLTPPSAYRHAVACNLLEDDGEELRFVEGTCAIPVKPWQIATVRLSGVP